MVGTTIVLGLGELQVSSDSGAVLSCLGLGSCVAFSLYDPVTKAGGMAHMVLPSSAEGRATGPKFVDVAVPMLLVEMEKLGSPRGRLVAKLVGGAQMMTNITDSLNIGQRNADAARDALESRGIKLAAEDLGGHQGRTVRLCLDSGELTVATVGGSAYAL